MNLKKYCSKISEHNLTDEQCELLLEIYKEGNTLYPTELTIGCELQDLKIINISYMEPMDSIDPIFSLKEHITNKLDTILLSHTNKKEWQNCFKLLYPKDKINSSYPNISFLSIPVAYQRENFVAYWSDTLKIGNIIHPHNYDNNYNEFMDILITKEKLGHTIEQAKKNKQQTCKI